jgi:hypothetical protein
MAVHFNRRTTLWVVFLTQVASLALLGIGVKALGLTNTNWLTGLGQREFHPMLVGFADFAMAYWWLGAMVTMVAGQLMAVILVLAQGNSHLALKLLLIAAILVLGPLVILPYALHQLFV